MDLAKCVDVKFFLSKKAEGKDKANRKVFFIFCQNKASNVIEGKKKIDRKIGVAQKIQFS